MIAYLILVLIAAASRLIDHPVNIAPLGALALLTGVTALAQTGWKRTAAYTISIVALLVSDAFLGFYTWQVMAAVYLGFGLTIAIGWFVRRHYHWTTIIASSLTASVLFFLLTNTAVWAFTPMYSKTLSGLMQSYIMAVPFFRNSLLGDLVYTGILFGLYEVAVRPSLFTRKQPETAVSQGGA